MNEQPLTGNDSDSEGKRPECSWLSQSPMTSGSPKAVVTVLHYYEMFWVYVYTSPLCHPLVAAYMHIHKDAGAGAGLLLRRNEPRALISRGLSSICPCTVYTLTFIFTNKESLESFELKNDRL